MVEPKQGLKKLFDSSEWKDITKILLAMEGRGSDTWIDWSGHVEQLTIRVIPKGYDSKQAEKFNASCYLKDGFSDTLASLYKKLAVYAQSDYLKQLKEDVAPEVDDVVNAISQDAPIDLSDIPF